MIWGASLFGDRVVAKGKGVEVKSSEVEDAFISYKANQGAAGKPAPESPEDIKKVETDILEHLIATKLFLSRAIEADRTNSAPVAAKFIQEKRERAASEASFRRQMLAIGMTIEQFEQQVREQALVKAVIDRELRSKQSVSDAEIEQFYKENPAYFQEPESWKIAHIHFAVTDRGTLNKITPEEAEKKQALAAEISKRAKAGEDFTKLAKEFSEDFLTKNEGGEYTLVKGQMPPEFEAAAISLKPGQVSDVVETRFGWHVIKSIEHIPAKTADLASSKEKIKDAILQQKTQKALPDYVQQLRKEANIEIVETK